MSFSEITCGLGFSVVTQCLRFLFIPLTTTADNLPFEYLSSWKIMASVFSRPSKPLTTRPSFISTFVLKQRVVTEFRLWLFCSSFYCRDVCFLSVFSAYFSCWWSPFQLNLLLLTLCRYKNWQAKERYFCRELPASRSLPLCFSCPITEVCLSRLSSEKDARECCTQRNYSYFFFFFCFSNLPNQQRKRSKTSEKSARGGLKSHSQRSRFIFQGFRIFFFFSSCYA